MNRIYRIVWNATISRWVVASEMAKGRKKSSVNKVIAAGLLLAMAGMGSSAFAATGTVTDSNGSTIIASDVTGSCAAASATGSSTNFSTLAMGCGATSTQSGVAIGDGANAVSAALALGGNANASGFQSLAFGSYATASQGGAIALGHYSLASGFDAIAAGSHAQANGYFSLAFGERSQANGENGVAIGSTASIGSDITNSVALGAGSVADATTFGTANYNPGNLALSGLASADNGVVSVGSAGLERRITNVAPGGAPTDAVNVSQLQSEDAKVNTLGGNTAAALGGGATFDSSTGAVTPPSYNVAGGTQNDVGAALSALDAATVQFNGTGGAANVKGQKLVNVAAGELSAASTDAVNGSQLYTTNQQVTANTTNISNLDGRMTNVEGNVTNLTNSINTGTVGLVQQDAATHNITMAKDADGAVVDVSGAAGTRTVTGVSAGTLGSDSTDAVNGSQLYATNQAVAGLDTRVTNVENSLGTISHVDNSVSKITQGQAGMFQVSADNTTVPAVTGTNAVAGGAGAVASGDNSAAIGNGARATAGNSTAIGVNAQATATNAVALGGGSVADRANTVSVGSAGNERQITNVAAGTASTDAVNVAQMQASSVATVNSANSYTDSQIGNVQGQINGLKQNVNDQFQQQSRRISGGYAMSSAMTVMAGSLGGIEAQNRIGAGTGFSNGQRALAVGYQRALSKSANITFGASTTGRDSSVGVGLGMGW
jgi:autotransporter adhesin